MLAPIPDVILACEIRPLALTNQDLGGVAGDGNPGVYEGYGPTNLGLVVTVTGEVTYVGGSYVYIDDGSGLNDGSGHVGVKVQLNGVAAPNQGDFVGVTGISGIESISGHDARVVLLADAADLVVFN